MTRLSRTLAIVALAALLALAAQGCGPKLPEPAQAVQSLLELRAQKSTDTTAYARYLESTSVAGMLAQDAEKQKTSPVPDWETPSVKSSSETSAVVHVAWKRDAAHKDFPAATDFILKRVKGAWVVYDATDTSSTAK